MITSILTYLKYHQKISNSVFKEFHLIFNDIRIYVIEVDYDMIFVRARRDTMGDGLYSLSMIDHIVSYSLNLCRKEDSHLWTSFLNARIDANKSKTKAGFGSDRENSSEISRIQACLSVSSLSEVFHSVEYN
jgi:hypothetical protein